MSTAQHRSDPPSSRHIGGWLWFWVVLALLAGAAGGYWVAGTLGEETAARRYAELKTEYEVISAQNRHDYQELMLNMEALQGELLVEQSTRKSLETALQSTQAELGRARDQLAFFDRLLPPGPSGSINVRALDFQLNGPTLAYKVLLMRNAPGLEAFTGQMQFIASGTLGGKKVELPLQPATAQASGDTVTEVSDSDGELSKEGPLALQFEQFQRSEGLLALPEGFKPVTITLNVLEGKTLRVSRSVSLPPTE